MAEGRTTVGVLSGNPSHRGDPVATREAAQSRKGKSTGFSLSLPSSLLLVSPIGQTSSQAKRHRSLGNVGQGLEGQGMKLTVNGQMISIALSLFPKK